MPNIDYSVDCSIYVGEPYLKVMTLIRLNGRYGVILLDKRGDWIYPNISESSYNMLKVLGYSKTLYQLELTGSIYNILNPYQAIDYTG